MSSLDPFSRLFIESIKVKKKCVESGFDSLLEMGEQISVAIQQGNKVMLCGNGGSAADAQHLAAELLVRLRKENDRCAIPAISLAQDTSTITACGNDFEFAMLYERMIKAFGKSGDCLIALTTSGNSENVIRAMKVSKRMGINVFGFLGGDGGEALEFCDVSYIVPSDITGRVQEVHIAAGHALMEFVEDRLIDVGYINLLDAE